MPTRSDCRIGTAHMHPACGVKPEVKPAYATLRNCTQDKPAFNSNQICARFCLYPDHSGKRAAEGGLRTRGIFKSPRPDKPLVTIVTTVLNRAHSIESAICSVLGQDYENIEYIIIDARSTDGTLQKIYKYSDVIDYFISEPDTSLYEGINKGISLASGDYILILNSDDTYDSNAVSTLVFEKYKRNAELVSGLARLVDHTGTVLREVPSLGCDARIMMRMLLRHELMLISRELYNTVGLYDISYKIIADLKLTQSIFKKINSFYEVDRPLMRFMNCGIASMESKELIDERVRLIGENFPVLSNEDRIFLSKVKPRNYQKVASMLSQYKDSPELATMLQSLLRFYNYWNYF